MKGNQKIKAEIECSVAQLCLIQHALDVFARLGTGQMETLEEHWGIDEYLHAKHTKDGKTDYSSYHEEKDALRININSFKMHLFGMGANASYGIHAGDISDTSRSAWDMIQVIRHELWKQDADRTSGTVNSYPASRSSEKEELIKFKILETA